MSSLRKQGPITIDVDKEERRLPACPQHGPRRMGPCFRRDDDVVDVACNPDSWPRGLRPSRCRWFSAFPPL